MRDYLEKLQSEYEQIALNQIGQFKPFLSRKEFKDSCDTLVDNLNNLRHSIDKLLKEHLYPTLERIEDISDKEEEELYEAAQVFSSFATRQDPGIALKIYKALLQRARNKKDDAKILKYLYWCGITQYFFYAAQNERVLAYFEEGAAYANKYDSFDDPEIRKYIHRCMGNRSMMLHDVKGVEEAMAVEESNFSFWNKLIFEGKDPDFPWSGYFLNGLHQRRISLVKEPLYNRALELKKDLDLLLDASISMNKLYNMDREAVSTFGGSRYDYYVYEAQFLLGMVSIDDMVENIEKRQAAVAPDDFSPDAMFTNIHLNSYLMNYIAKLDIEEEKRDKIVTTARKNTIDYIKTIPMTMHSDQMNVFIRLIGKHLNDSLSPSEQLDFMLNLTTLRNIMVHAHSLMVGKVAGLLTVQLIKLNPECFIGFLDITRKEDVKKRTKKLRECANMSGLLHDIGKTACIETPYMNIRVLTDEEFELIKEHPEIGTALLVRGDGNTENDCFLDVITGHHKYYDNSDGYPEDLDFTKSKNKIMIDIISVSDSIVSSTDRISRTYADVISLQDICEEIKAEAGIRFSPVIAEVLGDEETYDALNRLLDKEYINVYYTAYLQAWSGR